jgi:hypothetical protein
MRGRLDAAPLEPRLRSREAGRVPDAKNGNQTAFYARREHISVAPGARGKKAQLASTDGLGAYSR